MAARPEAHPSTLRRIAALWRPHRWTGAAILIALLLQTVFTVVLALAVKVIIDGVVDGGSSPGAVAIVAVLLSAFIVSACASLTAGYLGARARAQILADVRTAAFEHLQRLSIGFHDRSDPGDLLAHFSSDVAHVAGGVVRKPLDALQSLSALLLYLPVMAFLEWRLTLAAAVALPLAVYAATRFIPPPDDALDEEKRRIGALLGEVSENLSAQRVIRAFGLGRRSRERFAGRVAELRETSTRADFGVALVATGARYGVMLVQLGVVAAGASLAIAGEIDPGTLAAFVALLTEVAWETTQIGSDALPEIAKAGAGIRRIDTLLAAGPVEQDGAHPTPVPQLTDAIEFTGVRFAYEDGSGALDGIDLRIPAGTFVAIVGPSGSGKSTMLSLLPRFHDPSAGAITIDGTDLRRLGRDELRSQMGFVLQDTYLFRTTLRENIAIGLPGATDEETQAAASQAGLTELIDELPAGLDTVVGGEGIHLSGGQRQRVGIARAIVRHPRLLLLDEVTSALDPAAEAAVNDTVRNLRRGRTVISVTHRLQSITDADLIVVIERGRITEAGRFEDLMDADGLFARLWEKQLGFTVSDDGRTARVTPERLRAVPLFADLSQEHLESLSEVLVSEHHPQGTFVFRQNDPADRFYVIARGVVEVIGPDAVGGDAVLAHLEDGDFFGEMALLDDAPRNAGIKAVTPTVTLSLGRDQFRDLLAGSPQTAASVQAVARARAAANRT